MFENDEDVERPRLSRRLLIAGGFQAAAFAAIGARLFDLQVIDNRIYGPRADKNRLLVEILPPKRGRIFDNSGTALAENSELFRAAIIKAQAIDIEQTLKRVQEIIALSPVEVAAFRKRFKRAHGSTNVVLAEGLSFDQIARLSVNTALLPGLSTEVIWQRAYPAGESVGHIIGFVGKVRTDLSYDDPVLKLPGMRIGKSGIEAGYETELRGNGGRRELEIDARGRIVRELKTVPPIHGRDIRLTVNADTQDQILRHLQSVPRASCAAVDIETGEIRALVSTPSYDPETLAQGITHASWDRLADSENKPLLNRAVGARYQPASAFKPATALAALAAGLVSEREPIRCTGEMVVNGETYRCRTADDGHGELNLEQALTHDCDIYFYELARRVKLNRLIGIARQLGLAERFEIGLPEERAGEVPASSSESDNKLERVLEMGIGKGDIEITPLHLATMTARIAGGKQLEPKLELNTRTNNKPDIRPLAIDQRDVETVRRAFNAAQRVRSQTGPAQKPNEQRLLVQRDAVFTGVTPQKSPRVAVGIVVEQSDITDDALTALANDIMTVLNKEPERGRQSHVEPAQNARRQKG